MAQAKRTKVARYYWFRPHVARILREYTLRERRKESEQVEMFVEEALQRRGLITAEQDSPPPQTPGPATAVATRPRGRGKPEGDTHSAGYSGPRPMPHGADSVYSVDLLDGETDETGEITLDAERAAA